MNAAHTDWYAKRNDLLAGMIFRTTTGDTVMLDRTVPGDGTKWYVADLNHGGWSYEDSTIEPGDLAELLAPVEEAS